MGLKCPSVHLSVCLFTKSFFDFNKIWYVGRGRRLTHDGMQYDPIQGQGQGDKPLNVRNSAIFKGCLLPHLQWGLASDHRFLNYDTIPKLIGAGFWIFVLVFVSRDFDLDLGLGHTAYHRASFIDLYLQAKFC